MNTRQDVRLVSAHDLRCLAAIDTGHIERYYTRWLTEDNDPPNTLAVDYLRVARPRKPPYTNQTALVLSENVRTRAEAGGLDAADENKGDYDRYVRPSIINEAIAMDLSCARDHKWRLVAAAIDRQECNCVNQVRLRYLLHVLRRCAIDRYLHCENASLHCDYVVICPHNYPPSIHPSLSLPLSLLKMKIYN